MILTFCMDSLTLLFHCSPQRMFKKKTKKNVHLKKKKEKKLIKQVLV